jgi:hypothetical protein
MQRPDQRSGRFRLAASFRRAHQMARSDGNSAPFWRPDFFRLAARILTTSPEYVLTLPHRIAASLCRMNSWYAKKFTAVLTDVVQIVVDLTDVERMD